MRSLRDCLNWAQRQAYQFAAEGQTDRHREGPRQRAQASLRLGVYAKKFLRRAPVARRLHE